MAAHLKCGSIKCGKDFTCLTAKAERTVKKHINAMVKELKKMDKVEFLYEDEEEGCVVAEWNGDTAFRDSFITELTDYFLDKVWR